MVPKITLSDGNEIPQVGLGLWQVKDEAEFNQAFEAGVAAGYRHFDSAQAYGNEQMLGAAWKESGLGRSDIWITTKIAVEHFGHKHALSSFGDSLKNLQTDYVDLILLHFPVPVLRKKSWTALEEIKAAGQAKSIGVSNYTIKHLEEMKKYAQEMPAVNQVELHVFLQQPELIKYCREHNIAVEAYSPLAHAKSMDEPAIAEIAKKHGKSYAQVMLRWCLQTELIVLPKSVTPSRIQENIDLFDFELDADDMQHLTTLNKNLRTCWDPTHIP
jgi:diketogulonate reductase-like aldo/keto reductase